MQGCARSDEVTTKPDATKFLMLIPETWLLCRDVPDVSKNYLSEVHDVGAVVVAVVLEVRGFPR